MLRILPKLTACIKTCIIFFCGNNPFSHLRLWSVSYARNRSEITLDTWYIAQAFRRERIRKKERSTEQTAASILNATFAVAWLLRQNIGLPECRHEHRNIPVFRHKRNTSGDVESPTKAMAASS